MEKSGNAELDEVVVAGRPNSANNVELEELAVAPPLLIHKRATVAIVEVAGWALMRTSLTKLPFDPAVNTG